MADNTPFIAVDNFSFTYPVATEPALNGISFTLGQGEFLGLTGPSGAGKSTLCLALRGLIPHAVAGKVKGSITINGLNTRTTSAPEIGEYVGIVFQDPEAQIIGLTVEEDLAFGPENYEWPAERIWKRIPEVLEIVRLDGMEKRETWSLSGGQKQRVAIAAALIMEPAILVLDEPTSELDPIGKEEVFSTIRHLREDHNVTIIMVTHAIEQLTEVADQIIVMNEGQIADMGPPTELFRNVELFQELQGERLPQIAEVLFGLEKLGYLKPEQFTPHETEGIEILARLLEAAK